MKQVIYEIDGSYGLLVKSSHYPNEVVATRKGSPLLVGVKTERKLKVDFVDVEFPDMDNVENELPANQRNTHQNGTLLPVAQGESGLRHSQSRAFLSEDGMPQPAEFFYLQTLLLLFNTPKSFVFRR